MMSEIKTPKMDDIKISLCLDLKESFIITTPKLYIFLANIIALSIIVFVVSFIITPIYKFLIIPFLILTVVVHEILHHKAYNYFGVKSKILWGLSPCCKTSEQYPIKVSKVVAVSPLLLPFVYLLVCVSLLKINIDLFWVTFGLVCFSLLICSEDIYTFIELRP